MDSTPTMTASAARTDEHLRAMVSEVRAVPVVVGKKPSEMRNSEDLYKVVGLTPGDEIMSKCDYFSCKLGSYT